MNRFKLRVSGVPGDSVKILSDLDRSQTLPVDTWEDIQIGRHDLGVIKNRHESQSAQIEIEGLHMRHGRIVFRPSRQSVFSVFKGRKILVTLTPGESMTFRAEGALDPDAKKFIASRHGEYPA